MVNFWEGVPFPPFAHQFRMASLCPHHLLQVVEEKMAWSSRGVGCFSSLLPPFPSTDPPPDSPQAPLPTFPLLLRAGLCRLGLSHSLLRAIRVAILNPSAFSPPGSDRASAGAGARGTSGQPAPPSYRDRAAYIRASGDPATYFLNFRPSSPPFRPG